MELLPTKVVLHILSYLPYDDVFNSVCLVNRRLQEIAQRAYLDASEMSIAEATKKILAGGNLRTLKIRMAVMRYIVEPDHNYTRVPQNEEVRTNAI